MSLILVEGPPAGGKTGHVGELKSAGVIQVVADLTPLWAAVGQVQRGPDGRYPIRQDSDPALHTARYLKTVAVGFALGQGFDVAVTASKHGTAAKWAALAAEHNTPFSTVTVDPGEAVVARRLADSSGKISPECQAAMRDWF